MLSVGGIYTKFFEQMIIVQSKGKVIELNGMFDSEIVVCFWMVVLFASCLHTTRSELVISGLLLDSRHSSGTNAIFF